MPQEKKSAITSTKASTPSTVKKPATGQVQSLVRGLNILKSLAEHGKSMSLFEIADDVVLASSTAHRLLSSLEQQGFVIQDEQRGKWSIGIEAFNVGNGFLKTRDVIAIARPFMRELMEKTGETSNLGILNGFSSVLIAQVECKELMRMVATLGGRTPAHVSGIGKALLSEYSQKELKDHLFETKLSEITENTITNPTTFTAHLADIKQQGFSIDDEEQSIGLRCIAANIYNEHNEAIAAISISGPKVRLTDDRLNGLGNLLNTTASQITFALGGKAPTEK